jgi:glycosyltransferase involved in cell wall biosynthesis
MDPSRFDSWIACNGSGEMLDAYESATSGALSLKITRLPTRRAISDVTDWQAIVDPDIVHSHLWTADALVAAARGRFDRTPCVSTVWGPYFLGHAQPSMIRLRRWLVGLVYRLVYRRFDRVVALSNAVAADLRSRPGFKVPAEKIGVIHPAIDVRCAEREAEPDPHLEVSRPWITIVGNLFAIKGHRTALRAFSQLLRRFPQATLILVGAGPEREGIEALARQLGITARVLLTGLRNDARAILARSDVAVCPSLAEGFGIAILEALALGCPVVASRVGGIPEILEDESNGLLVPVGDAKALAAAIARVLADQALAARFAKSGRGVLRRFEPERQGREYAGLYERLVESGASRRESA